MKSFNRIKSFIVDYIWQFPQNIFGMIYLHQYKSEIDTTIISNVWNCNIYLTSFISNITFGKYIFICKEYKKLPLLLNHLIGHSILSKKLGILYLPLIGMPSLFWALFYNAVNYTELLADWQYKRSHALLHLLKKQK